MPRSRARSTASRPRKNGPGNDLRYDYPRLCYFEDGIRDVARVNKECPHCHAYSFGWRELLTLGSFSYKRCKNCHKLVRNSGWRQLLAPCAIISIIGAAIRLWGFIAPEKEVFIIPVVVIVLPLVLVLIAKPVKAEGPQADLSPFTPDPDNDKAILIQGWNEDELRQILDDFVEEDLSAFAAFRIEIKKRLENSFALTFPEDVHPVEFLSLINYLAYPINFDPAGRSIIVAGKTTLNSDFDNLPKSLAGKKALLYLPENDEDYDVVCLQTESGVTLARSFNEGIWRKVKDARPSSEVKSLTWQDVDTTKS